MPAPNLPYAAMAKTSVVPWSRFTGISLGRCPTTACRWCMFTHQDPAVWADLGMILWAAGLKATAAWTISTETVRRHQEGQLRQGTVCLVLRKRVSPEPGFLDEVYPLVEDEVRRQIASMQALDEDGEPNFNDADYQLAAYAAALKVLTQYATLDGKDVEHEVFAVRDRNTKSDFQIVIERAITIACDILIPRGLDALVAGTFPRRTLLPPRPRHREPR